jgi:hypothetical protein
MLFFKFKEIKILQKSLDKMEGNILLFVTNGLDNLYFLLMVLNKPSNTKYFAITYSWDNISSKFILSKKLDHIALWNGVQQKEIKEIYGAELIASSVIGSKLADRSHKFYSKMKTNTQNSKVSSRPWKQILISFIIEELVLLELEFASIFKNWPVYAKTPEKKSLKLKIPKR